MSGWQHDRRSRHERGYGTAWDKKRKVILKRDNYLCQCDDCKGGALRVRPASEVDHRIGKAEWQRRFGNLDGCDDDSNLQAIHPACHAAKTQRESGNPSRTVGCDINGWPLDPGHHWNAGPERKAALSTTDQKAAGAQGSDDVTEALPGARSASLHRAGAPADAPQAGGGGHEAGSAVLQDRLS